MKILVTFLLNLLFISAIAQSKLTQAKAFFENKKYTEAGKILLLIDKKDKDFAEAKFYLGRISFEQKKFDDAVEYFETAVEYNTTTAAYYSWLGNAYGAVAQESSYVTQAMLAPKMRNAWESASKLDPKNTDARWSLLMFYTFAPEIMGGGIAKAKIMATEIKKINLTSGYQAFGFIYERQNLVAEAEKEYTQIIKSDSANIAPLVNFYIKQKQYTKAFPLVENALKSKSNDYSIIYLYGKLSALSGKNLDKGVTYLEKYLQHKPAKTEPSIAGAQMRLGQIYEKKGNKPEAKKYYQLALKQEPNLKDASEGLKRVMN
ncbi:MAG TPA: hypothetical protein DCQ31_00815 [Bacteroidales bacterium]|nr:hypothetical protein [Bacteroidales bacterium]